MDSQSHRKHGEATTFIFDGPSTSSYQRNNKTTGCFSECNPLGTGRLIVKRNGQPASNNDGPKESKDKDAVENFLAESMKKLSIEDREKALAEVHGVIGKIEDIDDDSPLMDGIFKRLETHLLLIKNGTSYERAEQLNEAYVTNRPFRLMFLKAHQYDPKPAAERLVRFFELKEELFGIEKSVQEILIEDLDEVDIWCLESGCCQLLPNPDRANRRVLLMVPGLRGTCPIEHHMRAQFYMMMTTLRESEQARKNGVVGITYDVGRFRDMGARADATRVAKLTYSLPIPFSGLHFCHSDIRQYVMAKAVVAFLPLLKMPMFRSHYGTHAEIMYALRAYGISEDTLPFSHFDGECMYHNNNMWCHDRKEKDARISMERKALMVADFPTATIDVEGEDPLISTKVEYKFHKESKAEVEIFSDKPSPRSHDVLFGHGYKLHPGNVKLHKLIDQHAEEYATKRGKKEKMDYALRLVQSMKNEGSLFLIFESGSRGWVEVPESQARNKVAKTIRNRRRK